MRQMSVFAPEHRAALDVLTRIIGRRLHLERPIHIDIVRGPSPQASAHVVTGLLTFSEGVLFLPKRDVAVLVAHEVAHFVLADDPERARPWRLLPQRLHRLHLEMVADAAAARLFGAGAVIATMKGLHPNPADRRISVTHPSFDTRRDFLVCGRYADRWQHVEPPVSIKRSSTKTL